MSPRRKLLRSALLFVPLVITLAAFPMILGYTTNQHDKNLYAPSDFSSEQVFHFDFEGESADTVVDGTRPRTNGTVHGDAEYRTMGHDSTYYYSGDSERITVQKMGNLSEATVSFQLKLEDHEYSEQYIFVMGKEESWWFFYTDGTLVWRVDDGNGENHQVFAPEITPNEWHHVIGTFSSEEDSQRIYVDGTLSMEKELDSDVDIKRGDSNFTVGGPVYGGFDDVRLFSSSLSNKEVRSLSNGKTRVDPIGEFVGRAVRSGLLVVFGFVLAYGLQVVRR